MYSLSTTYARSKRHDAFCVAPMGGGVAQNIRFDDAYSTDGQCDAWRATTPECETQGNINICKTLAGQSLPNVRVQPKCLPHIEQATPVQYPVDLLTHLRF